MGANASTDGAREGRFALDLTFVAAVTIQLEPIQVIGKTPDGVRINFYARGGTVVGPRIRGTVFPGASDHMIVRSDGVGVIRVRATIVADDGALFEVDEVGSIEFGEDGYRLALANKLPPRSRMVICPRILTAHSEYAWINRAQCVGVGSSRLDERIVEYDLFAVASRDRELNLVRVPERGDGKGVV